MYVSGNGDVPEGFAGPNDHWHRHQNVCVTFGAGQIQVPFPADSDVTPAMCSGAGGRLIVTTTWMVHAWVVPGWESPEGVFSHAEPERAVRRRHDEHRQRRLLRRRLSNETEFTVPTGGAARAFEADCRGPGPRRNHDGPS